MIQILRFNHQEEFSDLFNQAEREIKIISPYLSTATADTLIAAANDGIHCTFITRVYVDDFLHHASNIDALRRMLDAGIAVYAVIALHAKLYLFDHSAAVIGSANFTASGLKSNLELSVEAIDEDSFISDLHSIYDDILAQVIAAGDGLVTHEMLNTAETLTRHAYEAAKDKNHAFNAKRFGADIRKGIGKESIDEIKADILSVQENEKSDTVYQYFAEKSKHPHQHSEHSIWLKFEGIAENRGDGTERKEMAKVSLASKTVYIANAHRGMNSFKDGDEIYIANISTDSFGRSQPIIVGRGVLRGYDKGNLVPTAWLTEYPWMGHFNHYCVIDHFEILDVPTAHAIPLDSITMQIGSDTFAASYGRDETPRQIAIKHHQKSYMEITPEAKALIDKQFDAIKEQHGTIEYVSE